MLLRVSRSRQHYKCTSSCGDTFVITLFLTPGAQTLTRSISSDTIVASTAYLLLLHLYLHDYNFVNSVTDTLTGSLSLGAAVFASVLLASRMRSQVQAFAQARGA